MENNLVFLKFGISVGFECARCAWCGIMVFLCVDYESKSAQTLRRLESGFFLYILNIKRSHKSHSSLYFKPSEITLGDFKMTFHRFFRVFKLVRGPFNSRNTIKYFQKDQTYHHENTTALVQQTFHVLKQA